MTCQSAGLALIKGIELDKKYFKIAKNRIENAHEELKAGNKEGDLFGPDRLD